jgi:hypothetical protein
MRREKNMKSTNYARAYRNLRARVFTAAFLLGVLNCVQVVAAVPVLTVNSSTYTVGENIVYVIKGAPPNTAILWSSWKDGVSTGEIESNYGHRTDIFGNWMATVGPWTENLIGVWRKQVRIGGQTYSVTFQVQPRPLSDFASKVGQYYWTPPQDAPGTIDYAAERISELGGRTMHLAFFTGCAPAQTLLQRAQMEDAVRAFGHPGIKSYVLTTYGASGCGSAGRVFFDPKLYPEIAPAIEQEFRELTLHLYQSYQGSGKRFVISTWEGDNVLHCGSAYLYANNLRIAAGPDGVARDTYGGPMPKDPNDPQGRSIPFRDYCDAIYPRLGIANVNEAHEGYRLWLEARQRGIRQGRDEAAALGLMGVEVYHAPEINAVNLLDHPLTADGQPLLENGEPVRLRSILRDVLPHLQNGFDFVSYSAYETTNLKSPGEDLESLRSRVIRDLNTIRQFTGSRNIIIGEFGYARHCAANPHGLLDEQVIARTDAVMDAALEWGVAAIFTWQMFDDQWGTFDARGNLLPLGNYFRQRYSLR